MCICICIKSQTIFCIYIYIYIPNHFLHGPILKDITSLAKKDKTISLNNIDKIKWSCLILML